MATDFDMCRDSFLSKAEISVVMGDGNQSKKKKGALLGFWAHVSCNVRFVNHVVIYLFTDYSFHPGNHIYRITTPKQCRSLKQIEPELVSVRAG